MVTKLYRNCRIFTPLDRGFPLSGTNQASLLHYEAGALLVQDGCIAAIGNEEDVLSSTGVDSPVEEIDCHGRCMIPGFVDPHTHMCFATLRESEFALRIGGVPYMEILQRGGGILSSVRAVADTDADQLYAETEKHVLKALSLGTTTVEIKSGYGLDTVNELKMLEVIGRIGDQLPVDVVPTFLGAHAVPEHYRGRADDYITMILQEMLPAVQRQGIARQCDIFCEKGVFTITQSRRLLLHAQKSGLKIKLHADEVQSLGGAGLAAGLGALSADHLLAVSETDIAAMAAAGVVATLLPATAYSLQKSYAPARKMIEENVAVALATDCNPGSSFTESMPFVFGLAVLCMKMSPAEALTAATLNAAYAIDMAECTGSLDIGKQADFLLLQGETPAILAYHAGVSAVDEVYKKGELVRAA